MTSLYIQTDGDSRFSGGNSYALSTEERDAWAYFDRLADDKKAVWIDPRATSLHKYLGVSDSPARARIIDRCGDRVFTRVSELDRHPILMEEAGKPIFLFGAGGVSPNELSSSSNGAMICADGVDGRGVGDNNPDVWVPGVGWSAAWKSKLPVPSTTVNGVAFGSATGGFVFGNATTADDTSSGGVGNSLSTGRAEIHTKSSGSNASLGGSTDRRDSAWHDYIMTYNPATTTLRIWEDGVAVTPNTAATDDVSTATGSSKIMLGARGRQSGGPTGRFIGFLAYACWLQGPVFESAAARAAIRALMATR